MKRLLSLILIIPLLVYCGSKEEPTPKPNPGEQTDPGTNPRTDPGTDPGTNPGGEEQKPEAVVTLLSKEVVDVGFEGGSTVVRFTANYDWTLTSEDKWVHPTSESGAASENTVAVIIKFDDNPSTHERVGRLVIAAGSAQKSITVSQPSDPLAIPATPLENGSTVLATNPNVEKFLTEVDYPDKDLTFTRVLDFYGGFNGKTYDEYGNEDPAGKAFDWDNQPNSDRPMSYSINWTEADLDGDSDMVLVLSDMLGWQSETAVSSGDLYVNITNLVPNDQYTYKVTSVDNGKVVTQGSFSTTGHLHQVFFKSGCRNGRDLGGWKTLDGKTVKYRRLYRGGRMQSETVNASGKKEIMAEGIGGQLDLRNSDRINKPVVDGMEFLAPGIEQGGTTMLKTDHAKTKQCFEFIVNCLRNNKSVYFHCSLGRDRTGTLDILLLGLLGVREGDISKAYEVTYFAPVGYSVSSSEKSGNPEPIFLNTRMAWAYSDVAPYFWTQADKALEEGVGDGSFASGVEYYLLNVAQVSQKDIDDFRNLMLD